MEKIQNIKPKTTHYSLPTTNLFIGRDRDYFVENLSMLASSGMGILEALNAILAEVRTKKMRRLIEWMKEEINAGSALWRVLEKTRLFPAHLVSLIRIGEEAGKLAQNLKIVGQQQEKERMFRSKVRSAMMYPAFVLSLTFVVGIGIAWFILPKLALVFSQLRLELPLVTKVLIGAGTFLGEHGAAVMPTALLLFALLVYFIFYFPKTKIIGQNLLFWSPGVKELIKEVELSRFSYLLGTLLEAGLPVVQAIGSIEQATIFPHYKNFYARLKTSVEEGNSFQKSFASYKRLSRLIPMPVQQIIISGEKSGRLSEALLGINQNYESKIETTTKNLTVILEPILLVIVWLGVVAVALAVILPIYNLIGGLNQGENPPPAPAVEQPETQVLPPAEQEIPQPVFPRLTITETETGYLNARGEPSLAGSVLERVAPGETYQFTSQKDGWYEIILNDGRKAWVSGKYVKEITSE